MSSMFKRFGSSANDKSNSTSSPSSIQNTDPETRFTLPHLRNLHKTLSENKFVNSENETLVVEILRVLAEMVLYGDSKSELLFDFFCEKNMLSLFLEIMRSPTGCPIKVHVQILQTLSILCQCVKNNTSLYYLLSNNYINDIIRYPYNFEIDEISDIFISFMKSLSLRFNEQTIQFFFIEESNSFPILSKAIEFLKFRDPMVRTGAQSTILNIFRIDEPKARQYSLNHEIMSALAAEVVNQFEGHYSQIQSLSLEYLMYSLQPKMKDFTEGKMGLRIEYQIQSSLAGIEDWLMYLEDIFGLQIPSLSHLIIQQFSANFVYPFLLSPLLKYNDDRDRIVSSDSQQPSDGSPEGTAVGEHETESNSEEQSMTLMISLFLLIQLMNTMRDKNMRRALTVALFHPLNQSTRKSLLSLRSSETNLQPHYEKLWEGVDTRNSIRVALLDILRNGSDRFVVLVALLVESTIRQDVNSCNGFLSGVFEKTYDEEGNCVENTRPPEDGIEAVASVLEPIILLKIWDGDDQATVTDGVILESPEKSNGDIKSCISDPVPSNNLMDDLNAEATTTASSPSTLKKDYKREMNEYAYGCEVSAPIATRGRGGSDDITYQLLDPNNTTIDDAIAVVDLTMLDQFVEKSEQNGLIGSLLGVLSSAHKYSLTTLQVVSIVLYDLARLSHHAGQIMDDSVWQCPPRLLSGSFCFSPHFLQSLLSICSRGAEASSGCSTVESKRSQTTHSHLTPLAIGWLPDTLLAQLEDEIRRASSSKPLWEETLKRMNSDVLLMLPPTPHLFLRLGTDHSVPNSEVEKSRREIQIFLLLRSLYKCLLRLVKSPRLLTTGEDIGKELLDQTISEFSEFAGIPSAAKVGDTIAMGGRHCYAAKIICPLLQLTEFAKTGRVSSLSPPVESQVSTPQSTSSRRTSLSPIRLTPPMMQRSNPNLSSEKTPERIHKFGEVYFINDELNTLLLTVPLKKLDSGIVLLTLPMNRVDAVIDSEDEKHVKLLVRSSIPMPAMARVSAETSSSGSISAYADGPKLNNVLPPRVSCSLYQMVIGFESSKFCEAAVKHVETCRLRVKSSRMESLRSMLQKWTAIEINNPDEREIIVT